MIRVLPESLVNKIAAGEVIVRPASVVKELVENAIDAGSTRIAVDLDNDCRDIRIRDDGNGMTRQDAELALVRHATSKIAEFDDLWSLETRGFRGEALASIAAVSRLQILTRRRGEIAGSRISAEGAGNPRVEPAGTPEGTDVRVRDLFFNTPARLKFMKSATSELQQILIMVTRQALIRPDIGFTLGNGKSILVDLPPGQPWAERIVMLLGSQVAGNLLEVNSDKGGIRIRGFVAKPSVTRKDRRQQYFFVNGRPVTSRTLSFILQQAYQGVIMTQRFPIAILEIVLPPGEVDINVHPTKEEVRFRSESAVNGALHKAVLGTLRAANLLPQIQLEPTAARPTATHDDLPFETIGSHDTNPVDFTMFTAAVQPAHPATTPRPLAPSFESMQRQVGQLVESELPPPTPTEILAPGEISAETECGVRPIAHSLQKLGEETEPEPHPIFRSGRAPEPLGQIAQCYIVAQAGNDLLLIDQHAAHERLLYMRFSQRNMERPTQPLLIPVSVDAPAAAVPYMEKLCPLLGTLGLRVEAFGGRTFLVQSVPADLPNLDVEGLIGDLLDDFDALGRTQEIDVIRDRVVTRMACRSAVKAGQPLHLDEMRALIHDIAAAKLSFTCPHGRPTMILLTRDQLDRQFKRRV